MSKIDRPIIAKRFQPMEELGSGSFGVVYLAEDLTTGDEVAVKIEKTRARHPQLRYESKVYQALQGGKGIPSIRYYGTEKSENILVIERLGKSLEDLFVHYNRRFETLTTLLVAVQMIERIEYMHQKHFIHRDIKPDNFMSGIGRNANLIYVIDFGLSKRYRHPKTKRHNQYREGKNLTGTPRYASINNHLGVEQSRRDDLESIGYVLAYFCRGKLPWQGLKANTKKQKYQKIMDKKMGIKIEKLCRGTPKCLQKYLEYTRTLKYDDRPNYGYLKTLFLTTIKQEYGEGQHVPQWVEKREPSSSSSRRLNHSSRQKSKTSTAKPVEEPSSRSPLAMFYTNQPQTEFNKI